MPRPKQLNFFGNFEQSSASSSFNPFVHCNIFVDKSFQTFSSRFFSRRIAFFELSFLNLCCICSLCRVVLCMHGPWFSKGNGAFYLTYTQGKFCLFDFISSCVLKIIVVKERRWSSHINGFKIKIMRNRN